MDAITALKERRSINFFDPEKTVTRDEIGSILEVANLSPSSFNLQPWEVVVVDDPERKKVLRKCAFNQPKVEEASAVLIIIADPGAVEKHIDRVLASMAELGYAKKEDIENIRPMPFKNYGDKESLSRLNFAVKNASLFAMSIMVAARGFGFETHPMDGFNEKAVKDEFGIPEDRIIPLLIAIGYPRPGLKLLPRAFRRRIEEFVLYNMYK